MKRDYVNIFKALSDPGRIRIVKMLAGRELCMCEIRSVLDLSNSTVSKHLTVLRDSGLVLDAKEGKWVNFRLNDRSERPFIRSIIGLIKKSFNDDETVIKDAVRLRGVDRKKICSM
jgi:ArsR family transcriptional regulator